MSRLSASAEEDVIEQGQSPVPQGPVPRVPVGMDPIGGSRLLRLVI